MIVFWILYYIILYIAGGFCFTLLWRKWIGSLEDEFPFMMMIWLPMLFAVIVISPMLVISFWLKDLQDKII